MALRSIGDVLQMDVPRRRSPEMVEKEIFIHYLEYNLIREVAAKYCERPRQPSFTGTLQTMTAFRDALRWARPARLGVLVDAMLQPIANHGVGDRPGRLEPLATQRRPRCQKLLSVPRREARNRLLEPA